MAVSERVAKILYPPIEPYHRGELAVDEPHELYFEECGRPDGIPVLFVHGGPGAGCSEADRRFFDPTRLRVVLVDQRGAGRSQPLGELARNTTEDLVRDFETLRRLLGIERWHVFGGSWGSTLALHYATAHPERVSSLVLRGIWLMRQCDQDWWFEGLQQIQPELHRAFREHLPAEKRGNLLEGYWELLNGPDRARALAAARAWSHYEGACCTLLPDADFTADFDRDEMAWSLARLEAHYFRNQRPRADDFLLRRVERIRHLPAFLVHGRYDVVCTVDGADLLHRAWPGSELTIVPDAGHASREPGTAAELVAACDRIARTGDPRRAPTAPRAP